jgi:hypothetical protein
MDRSEQLQEESDKLDILGKNVDLIANVDKQLFAIISDEIKNWLEDDNHPIYTIDFNHFLKNYINDIRTKKLNRIINE